jgi:hypothetical protein
MVLTLSTAVIHCSRDEAQTIDGTNGKNGSTILSGTTAPTLNIGEIGDYYLNKSTYDLYGPKTSDSWGTPINLKGREGSNGTAGSKIHAGTGIPAQNIGNNGDWYIDTQNKMLYGPKTDQGWGSGLALGDNSSNPRGNYVLSRDGKTILQWFDKETTQIDMQNDPELKEVTIIGKRAFYDGSLTSITLPNHLEKIGDNAFMDNDLTSIIIPNSVTSIGKYAFHGNNLTNVVIPNSVTNIGSNSFSGNQLTNVTIPNSVTNISSFAFSGNQLTNITIPNGVVSIGNQAFMSNDLTSITIPNSVTTIGSGAFGNNPLTNVTINAVTPPTISGDIFPYTYTNTNPNLKIYVPAGSLAAYKTAEGWSQYASQIYAQ